MQAMKKLKETEINGNKSVCALFGHDVYGIGIIIYIIMPDARHNGKYVNLIHNR